jgi:hypothetical protein
VLGFGVGDTGGPVGADVGESVTFDGAGVGENVGAVVVGEEVGA